MKKLKFIIATILATAAICIGFNFSPIAVNAEENAKTPEISVENGMDEEVVEGEPNLENSSFDEGGEIKKEELTFDDVLDFAGKLAEKEGYGNEWENALYYIETAASEKKVDLMIALGVVMIVLFVGDRTIKIVRWRRKRKTDTTGKDITDIKTASGKQTTAINSLIDEEEKVVESLKANAANVRDNTEREKALAEGIKKQNVAIRCLIRGTNIKQDLKDEAFRSLIESDDLCDKAKK